MNEIILKLFENIDLVDRDFISEYKLINFALILLIFCIKDIEKLNILFFKVIENLDFFVSKKRKL